jgi:hypothetical protein
MSGKKQGLTQYDASAAFSSPIFHPSTVIGGFTMVLAGIAQMSPRDFLPIALVGTKVHGVSVQKLFLLPASTVMTLYAACGVQIYEGHHVRGHLCSMWLSFACAAMAASGARVSMFYWVLFGVYLGYGMFYDGRKLAMYSDGAPTYRWGDFTRIRKERKAAKAKSRHDHDVTVELRRKQYEYALAAQASE